MTSLRHEDLWRPARDLPFLVFSAAVALGLVRAADQPAFTAGFAGTEVSLVPADAAFAALAACVVWRLLGGGSLPRPTRAVTFAAAAFSGWLLASSAANGGEAVVAATKLLEYGLIGLGAVLFIQRRVQLWLFVGVIVAVETVAVGYALLAFFDVPPLEPTSPGGRQPSFLGEHGLASLSNLALTFALATLFAPRRRLRGLAVVAGVAGALGLVLGAALAGLLGLYLGIAAILGLAVARGAATRRAVTLTVATALVVTVGALALRSGDLAAFARYLGVSERSEVQDENAAGWSQRLIYAYVGGRVFLDNPVLGTGWYGRLPPSEYARYLPDARARFSDQPPRYFPSRTEGFIPQQTYDQVLYELGILGALLFLVLVGVAATATWAAGRDWPRGDPDEPAAYLPAAWVGALVGGLAGAALFGGIPLAAIFWITLGVAALAPSLVPPPAARRSGLERSTVGVHAG